MAGRIRSEINLPELCVHRNRHWVTCGVGCYPGQVYLIRVSVNVLVDLPPCTT